MNDQRRTKDSFENRASRRRLKVESVPLDTEKLAADVPQSARRLLASSLRGDKGRGAVAETKEGVVVTNDAASHRSVISFLVDLERDNVSHQSVLCVGDGGRRGAYLLTGAILTRPCRGDAGVINSSVL